MNISLDKLALTISVFEETRESSFEGALRHKGSIHALKVLSNNAVLSAAEMALIDGAMERAEIYVASYADEVLDEVLG